MHYHALFYVVLGPEPRFSFVYARQALYQLSSIPALIFLLLIGRYSRQIECLLLPFDLADPISWTFE